MFISKAELLILVIFLCVPFLNFIFLIFCRTNRMTIYVSRYFCRTNHYFPCLL